MRRKDTAKVSSKDPGTRYRAPALDKGLDILELFAAENEALALSEVARRLGRTVGEIFRMITTLEQRGYLKLDPNTDRYHLTLHMFRLSHRHAPIRQMASASAVLMKILSSQTSQSCHIVVPFRGRGLIVVQQDPPTRRGFRVRLGAELELVTTCSGRILLAFSEAATRQQLLREAEAIGDDGVEDRAELERSLKEIVARRYYQVKSRYTDGVTDVGCPLFGHRGEFMGALTIPFLGRIDGEQLDIEHVREMLIQTAMEISENLGFDSQQVSEAPVQRRYAPT